MTSRRKAERRKNPERVGAIVRMKFNLAGGGSFAEIPAGTVGIVTSLNSELEPCVEFECGERWTHRERLLHWYWLEIIG